MPARARGLDRRMAKRVGHRARLQALECRGDGQSERQHRQHQVMKHHAGAAGGGQTTNGKPSSLRCQEQQPERQDDWRQGEQDDREPGLSARADRGRSCR